MHDRSLFLLKLRCCLIYIRDHIIISLFDELMWRGAIYLDNIGKNKLMT